MVDLTPAFPDYELLDLENSAHEESKVESLVLDCL